MSSQAIEHGSTRGGRWLQERRFRLTLALAAVEGLFYLVGFLHWWEAIALAVIGGVAWWYGRNSRSHTIRQVTFVFLGAQLLVVLVPFLIGLFKILAIALVALLAVIALVFLFTNRH